MVASASTRYQSPAGTLDLLRYPRRKQETLRAWCSADTLLIEAALTHSPVTVDLVVNDEHGALAAGLTPAALWTDSALAAQATVENLQRNNRPVIPVRWSNESPGSDLQLVLMRVPKSLSYFEYQLASLTEAMAAGGLLICGGMDKHLSPQTATLMEKYFGTVTRQRGQRKARIFTAHKQSGQSVSAPAPARYYCETLGASLDAGANVFSADSLDIGSRFLIEQLPRITPATSIADLACGNGVLGFCALKSGLGTELTLCDESAMAIAAARDNAVGLGMADATRFHHGDGFRGLEHRFDRILCNPPFHLGHAVEDFAGRRLLSQCAPQLAPGGELFVVANRHLEYGPVLKQYFRSVAILAQNRKFMVWVAKGS